jgi:hypothetical protein
MYTTRVLWIVHLMLYVKPGVDMLQVSSAYESISYCHVCCRAGTRDFRLYSTFGNSPRP